MQIKLGKNHKVIVSIAHGDNSYPIAIQATMAGLKIDKHTLPWEELKEASRAILLHEKAVASTWKPKIMMTDEGDYLVESQTGNGHFYEVSANLTMCQCPHYQKRLIDTNRKCKHMDQLAAYLKKEGVEIPTADGEVKDQIPF